jgi:hypothetical protein
MRGQGLGLVILIVGSVFYLVTGLWQLVTTKRFATAFVVIGAVVLWPFAFWQAWHIEDEHLRMWVAYLLCSILPMWLLAGYFVRQIASGEAKLGGTGARRWRGAALFVVGALAWAYGAAHSELTTGQGVVVLMVALYSLLMGSCWLIAGKKISELH